MRLWLAVRLRAATAFAVPSTRERHDDLVAAPADLHDARARWPIDTSVGIATPRRSAGSSSASAVPRRIVVSCSSETGRAVRFVKPVLRPHRDRPADADHDLADAFAIEIPDQLFELTTQTRRLSYRAWRVARVRVAGAVRVRVRRPQDRRDRLVGRRVLAEDARAAHDVGQVAVEPADVPGAREHDAASVSAM